MFDYFRKYVVVCRTNNIPTLAGLGYKNKKTKKMRKPFNKIRNARYQKEDGQIGYEDSCNRWFHKCLFYLLLRMSCEVININVTNKIKHYGCCRSCYFCIEREDKNVCNEVAGFSAKAN